MKKYEKWIGNDVDIETSIREYGVAIRKAINPGKNEYEYQGIFKYPRLRGGDKYIIHGVNSGYIAEKIVDITTWSNWDSFMSYIDCSGIEEFSSYELIQQISDLLNYFGYEEIFKYPRQELEDWEDVEYLINPESIPSWAQILLVPSYHGQYIPKIFAKKYKHLLDDEILISEDLKTLRDPEFEYYWDAFDNICDLAILTINGRKYYLWLDEDLFAIEENYSFNDDYKLTYNGTENIF